MPRVEMRPGKEMVFKLWARKSTDKKAGKKACLAQVFCLVLTGIVYYPGRLPLRLDTPWEYPSILLVAFLDQDPD